MQKLPWNNISIWATLAILLLTGGISWGVNQTQTTENTKDIGVLQEDRKEADEQRIRMEERQIRIQKDVESVLKAVERLNE